MQNVSTCLWFDTAAFDAATLYTTVIPNSKILGTSRMPEGGPTPAGTVMTCRFVLDGIEFLALNGNARLPFSPAVSLVAYTDSQAETDRIWDALLEGGSPSQCGWLADRFGVSWQVVPRAMMSLLQSKDTAASQRAMGAMMKMVKLDMNVLQRAFDGA